jgi:CubicO group peptidase (beta-lactamase class C family)
MGLRGKPLNVPGTKYLYSNTGYIVVGAMIEKVLDTDWEAALTQYVFMPLGMASAGFGGLGTPGEIDQPWGHRAANQPCTENGPEVDNPPLLGPAATVHCSIQDWALFVADQLRGSRGEQGLLKPQSYRMQQTKHFPGPYALGWSTGFNFSAFGSQLSHAGSNGLYYANVWVAPARDFAVLVCTNEGPDSSPAVEEVVFKMIWAVGRLKKT